MSEDREEIKIVTGPITRTGIIGSSSNNSSRRFTEYSTEIYLGGQAVHRYSESDLRESHIPAIRPIIAEASFARAGYEELLLLIDDKVREITDSELETLEQIGEDPWMTSTLDS